MCEDHSAGRGRTQPDLATPLPSCGTEGDDYHASRGSATSDRHRDLVAPPEGQGPGRIVEPPDRCAGRLEGSVLQCIQQLSGARCDGGRPTIAGEAEHGHRFSRNSDEADLVVVGLGQCVHGPPGRA